MLYFDEVYGYLPPTATPPSKRPLMTLLKQVRAFGVGVLLATQNPIDLDYKALSNAGTWFVGRLQTERDKVRLMDGLESAAAEQGKAGVRTYLEKVISSLGNRIFLMHDIHREKPELLQSRWALSFLRGPITREQVARLMAPLKAPPSSPSAVRRLRGGPRAGLTDHARAAASTRGPCGSRTWKIRPFVKAPRRRPRRQRGGGTTPCRPCCRAT